MMCEMKQKSLLVFITLTFLLSASIAFADVALTAELDDNSYEIGDIVTISGNLTDVIGPVDVEIVILNGSDMTPIDNQTVTTSTDSNDNFTATYDLTDTLPGEYIVNVTYGGIYVELKFEVEADDPEDPEDDTDSDDLSFAIERAEIYLERVRAMLEEFVEEYDQTTNLDIVKKLQELNETLDLAEEYLANATVALEEGDCNTAAKYHAAARNIMGRVKGILNSVIKEHKVQKTEKFMEQFQRRLNSTLDKINQLQLKLGTSNTDKVKTRIGNAYGQVKRYEGTINTSNVDDVIKGLRKAKGQVDDEVEDLGDEETANKIKNLNRYQAKISVLNCTQAKLQRRGVNTDALRVQIRNAESLYNQLKNNGHDNDLGIEGELDDAKDTAKDLRKTQINKGNSNSNNGNSLSSSRVKALKLRKVR